MKNSTIDFIGGSFLIVMLFGSAMFMAHQRDTARTELAAARDSLYRHVYADTMTMTWHFGGLDTPPYRRAVIGTDTLSVVLIPPSTDGER